MFEISSLNLQISSPLDKTQIQINLDHLRGLAINLSIQVFVITPYIYDYLHALFLFQLTKIYVLFG